MEITIKLADLNRLGMTVEPKDEEDVRLAEFYVNRVWSTWMEENSDRTKTSKDVLGMVAFHFAKLYVIEQKKNKYTDSALRSWEKDLDGILLDIDKN